MGVRENIILLRKKYDLSQNQLAEIAGVTRGAVSQWEGGFSEPRMGAVQRMADHFHISKSNIIEDGGMRHTDPKTGKIIPIDAVQAIASPGIPRPVAGTIFAGDFGVVVEESGETLNVDADLYEHHKSGYWMRVRGNSMNRLFPEGSMIYIDPNDEVRNGDVAAICVNGDEGTVKRVYFEGDCVRLHPESYDPDYRDRIIDHDEPDCPPLLIAGKVVGFRSPLDWKP